MHIHFLSSSYDAIPYHVHVIYHCVSNLLAIFSCRVEYKQQFMCFFHSIFFLLFLFEIRNDVIVLRQIYLSLFLDFRNMPLAPLNSSSNYSSKVLFFCIFWQFSFFLLSLSFEKKKKNHVHTSLLIIQSKLHSKFAINIAISYVFHVVLLLLSNVHSQLMLTIFINRRIIY